jgi:hypothetical protein
MGRCQNHPENALAKRARVLYKALQDSGFCGTPGDGIEGCGLRNIPGWRPDESATAGRLIHAVKWKREEEPIEKDPG